MLLTVIQLQTVFDVSFVESFKRLTEAVLAMLTLFNRRRQGEVSRLTVALYQNAATVSRQTTDVHSSLSPLEKHLLNAFHRVEIQSGAHTIAGGGAQIGATLTSAFFTFRDESVPSGTSTDADSQTQINQQNTRSKHQTTKENQRLSEKYTKTH